MRTIYLLSDSTGELAERFTNALITQFPKDKFAVRKHNFLSNLADVQNAFSLITPGDCILFHTVLSPELKRAINEASRQKKIPCYDLTGPPTDFMVQHFKAAAVWDVKAIHKINADYNKRIDAIEFTTNHDDGAATSTLDGADVILVGPSRTSKTPTSIYLAFKGFRVANVPIVPVVGIREDLGKLKGDRRVIGLVIQPEKLREVRLKRTLDLGTTPPGYTDLEEIHREVEWSRKVYRQHQWKTVDISDRAVEETAAIVIRKIQDK